MNSELKNNLDSIITRMANNYGSMLQSFRPFSIGGELNERNLTSQFLIEVKNSIPDAVICQEFHISGYSGKGDSAFVDAVVITNDWLLCIEAKRNSAITNNFGAIDRDIKKLNSEALKKQFKSVFDDRDKPLPQCAYGLILADSWKKSLTDKWIKEYSNEAAVDLNKGAREIADFADYSERYDLIYGVFKLD